MTLGEIRKINVSDDIEIYIDAPRNLHESNEDNLSKISGIYSLREETKKGKIKSEKLVLIYKQG